MASATIREIERAIGTLDSEELARLYQWLERHHPSPIDARLPSDLAAGRLDSEILRALENEAGGQLRSL
jgi:hypothetical protein